MPACIRLSICTKKLYDCIATRGLRPLAMTKVKEVRFIIRTLTFLTLILSQAHAETPTLRAVGSTSAYPFFTIIAEEFGRYSSYPAPVVEATGTGNGIKVFCSTQYATHIDIANASRKMHDSERALCHQHGIEAIGEVLLGYDGIVLAYSSQVKPRLLPDHFDVSRKQLFLALAKFVPIDDQWVENPYRTWKDVDPDLPDVPIMVYGPSATSGTRDTLTELVMLPSCKALIHRQSSQHGANIPPSYYCQLMREDGAYVEAGENDNIIIHKLHHNPSALGTITYAYFQSRGDSLKAVSVDQIMPDYQAIVNRHYPISRGLYVYFHSLDTASSPMHAAFIDELTSERALGPQGYLAAKGIIPLDERFRKQQRKRALGK
jgi:phosphate transport system substrate-binding protein